MAQTKLTIWVLGIGILGNGVEVIGAVLQVAWPLRRESIVGKFVLLGWEYPSLMILNIFMLSL